MVCQLSLERNHTTDNCCEGYEVRAGEDGFPGRWQGMGMVASRWWQAAGGKPLVASRWQAAGGNPDNGMVAGDEGGSLDGRSLNQLFGPFSARRR